MTISMTEGMIARPARGVVLPVVAVLGGAMLLSATAGAEPGAGPPPLRRINPAPVDAYEVRITLRDPPGSFVKAQFSAQYDVGNAATCGRSNPVVGNSPVIRTTEAVPLERLSDTEYVAIVHADLILDQDYHGRGVCRWAFTAATIGLVGTADDFGTWFVSDLGRAAVAGQGARTKYYWKGYYPRARMTGYSEFGTADPGDVPPDRRGEFFTITMTARKRAP